MDAMGRNYYLLSPAPWESQYPTTKENAPARLLFSIMVQGVSFRGKHGEMAADHDNVGDVDGGSASRDRAGDQEAEKNAGSTPHGRQRVRREGWFVVEQPEDMDQLVRYLQREPKMLLPKVVEMFAGFVRASQREAGVRSTIPM